MSLLATVLQSYQQCIPSSQSIVIACSGGRDSMALLYACHQLQLPIRVIHINHNIQADSGDWQQLVEHFCQTYHIPYQSIGLTWDITTHKINEQHARTARYQAILEVVDAHSIVATAHHANDQAETLLLNLCQGTGLSGLVGMTTFSEQTEFGKPIRLWRPLLTINREQISDFVSEHRLPYVDDPTNTMATLQSGNQRAFLREHILPRLQQRFGKLIENINRTQANLSDIKQIIDRQVIQDLEVCQLENGWTDEQQRLSIMQLQVLSQARRFQLLHQWIKGEQKFAPSRNLIGQVNDLILNKNSEQHTILQWQGHQIRRYRDTLYRLTPSYVTLLSQSNDGGINFLKLANSQLIKTLTPLIMQVKTRPVRPNEKFQHAESTFHESYKKICQRLSIPSWERGLAVVIIMQDSTSADLESMPIAILLPSQVVWLKGAPRLPDGSI